MKKRYSYGTTRAFQNPAVVYWLIPGQKKNVYQLGSAQGNIMKGAWQLIKFSLEKKWKSDKLYRMSIKFYINQYCFKSSVNRHTMVNFQKEFGDVSTWKKMILFLQRQMTKQSHPHHVRFVLLWVHNSCHYLCLLTARVQPKLTVENPGQSILVDNL